MSKHIKNLKVTLLVALVCLLGALVVIQFVLPAEDNPFSRGLASILGDGSEEVVTEVIEEPASVEEVVPLPEESQEVAASADTQTPEAAQAPVVETPAVEMPAQEAEQPAEDPNKDTDKDSIIDSLDECPWTFGTKVDSSGCRIKEPVKLTWPK